MKIILNLLLISVITTNNIFDLYTRNKYLYDFSGENKFLLEEKENSYNIYQIKNGMKYFSEGSDDTNSPYYNVNSQKLYYLGPGNYFYKKDNFYYNILTNKIYDELIYSYSLTDFENKITLINNNSEEFVNNYQFFEKMSDVPNNEIGDCGMVALMMLLSYFDTFKDDRFLPLGAYKKTFLNKEPNSLDDWSQSPYVTTSFKDQIRNTYGHCLFQNDEGYAMAATQIRLTMEDYLKVQNKDLLKILDIIAITVLSEWNIKDHIKLRIKLDQPVILTLLSYESYESSSINGKYHNVLIYGYGDGYFLAHLGYKNKTKIKISSSSTMFSSFSIEYKDIHFNHSSNFTTEIGEEFINYCGCFGYRT